ITPLTGILAGQLAAQGSRPGGRHTFLSAPRQVPPVFFRTLWYDGYKKGLNAKDKEYESGISI
ncbi:MAG: hypothetical protein ACLR0F_25650, partial [Eisenbergiella sp.]